MHEKGKRLYENSVNLFANICKTLMNRQKFFFLANACLLMILTKKTELFLEVHK